MGNFQMLNSYLCPTDELEISSILTDILFFLLFQVINQDITFGFLLSIQFSNSASLQNKVTLTQLFLNIVYTTSHVAF